MRFGTKPVRRYPWRAAQLLALAAGAALVTGCAGLRESAATPEVLDDWQRAFRTDPRWLGSDNAATIPIGLRKTMWLFGDTWIAPPDDPRRKAGRLVPNTIGLQRLGSRPRPIDFHWREDTGAVPRAMFESSVPDTFLWPTHGIKLSGTLCLFAAVVKKTAEEPGFGLVGNHLLLVENVNARPAHWKVSQYPLPYFEHSNHGDRAFGSAVLDGRWPDPFVYVYGFREDWRRGIGGREVIVARTLPRALLSADVAAWEFFDGDGWSRSVADAVPLFDAAATEFSVQYSPRFRTYIAVNTVIGMSSDIVARFAPRPEGPWSSPKHLYRCPDNLHGGRYFCYAGKAHPELARGARELVITYAVNSTKFDDHFNDLDLYWPRVVAVPLPKPFNTSTYPPGGR